MVKKLLLFLLTHHLNVSIKKLLGFLNLTSYPLYSLFLYIFIKYGHLMMIYYIVMIFLLNEHMRSYKEQD